MFAVVFNVQKKQVRRWCWGSCGKAQIGAIEVNGFTMVVCDQSRCPHLHIEMPRPFISLENGEPLFLRRLREIRG